jgi:hypothetical protein
VDFIERMFHLSPDGGTGFLECLLFLLPIVLLCFLAARRSDARTGSRTVGPISHGNAGCIWAVNRGRETDEIRTRWLR